MDRLKIGFIGCGGIARAHIRRLLKMDDVKPVAFTDINPVSYTHLTLPTKA